MKFVTGMQESLTCRIRGGFFNGFDSHHLLFSCKAAGPEIFQQNQWFAAFFCRWFTTHFLPKSQLGIPTNYANFS